MNTEKQLQLVTFEQAKRLRDLGFDWIVFHTFDENDKPAFTGSQENYNSYEFYGRVSCPTVALALKWIEDVKGIRNYSTQYTSAEDYIYFIGVTNYGRFLSREDAESSLLDELLTILEQQK